MASDGSQAVHGAGTRWTEAVVLANESDGTYKVPLPDWVAKYQAKVKPGIVNYVPCKAVSSPIVKHVH